jgi:hypothetical protein
VRGGEAERHGDGETGIETRLGRSRRAVAQHAAESEADSTNEVPEPNMPTNALARFRRNGRKQVEKDETICGRRRSIVYETIVIWSFAARPGT